MNIFFDVHGTLLSTDGGKMRPGTAELMRDLAEAGHEITFWSTAGAGYAREFAARFGLLPWVLEFRSKRYPDVKPDFCVDDAKIFLIGRQGNLLVEPYTGGEEDQEIENVRDAILVAQERSTEIGD